MGIHFPNILNRKLSIRIFGKQQGIVNFMARNLTMGTKVFGLKVVL